MRRHATRLLLGAATGLVGLAHLAACRPSTRADEGARDVADAGPPRLPTGARLDPAGREVAVLPFALALVPSPDGRTLVLLPGGAREQGVQLVDRATGRVTATLVQRSAFVGAAFAPDGAALWTSGGDGDVVYRYAWAGGRAALADSVVLAALPKSGHGTRYPAGLALSPDGRLLYVAENLADSLAVIDVARRAVVQRLPTQRYPYAVAVAPDGGVYVSAWGGDGVHAFAPTGDARRPLAERARFAVARHPSALLLNASGTRLFVASASTDRVLALDPRDGRVLATLHDPPPAGPGEGSTPNALALSADGTRLYAAEADANAVAVFALSARAADLPAATGRDTLVGRIPTAWYPTALAVVGDSLHVANAKGRGTGANPDGPQPRGSLERQNTPRANTTLRQLDGSLTTLAVPADAALPPLTARVARANGWTGTRTTRSPAPAVTHVVYVIKENRTYDQVLGDLPQGDGDTSLVFFPRPVSPNHHALAERFGLYDRFFVNAEVSPDGHNWSTAAYTTDYLQKTVPSNYSNRGRSYDYEGTNRGHDAASIPEDDVAEPANGYLWDLARRAGVSFRNYGEFVVPPATRDTAALPTGYRGNKPFLREHTHPDFPGYDLSITDQRRADVWIADLRRFAARGEMPRLQVIRLPNDHTAGARRGAPTPRAYMADNDLALGRMVEALSRTPFWRHTAMFVVEDDAQNGPDHVDSHRAPFLVVSPWARGGTWHRFTNTTDVLATIEALLGLPALSQFDHFGRPLTGIWRATPELRPYVALRPAVPLDEVNTAANATERDMRASARLALDLEDQADEDAFNRILWRAARGSRPYPGVRRAPVGALGPMPAPEAPSAPPAPPAR
jgi:YVTN family beta-propeller protein